MAENDEDFLPATTPKETALDISSIVATLVPWVGGPVAAVLTGLSLSRKIDRAREVLKKMSKRIEEVRSESSERYVKTDDFHDLLERTLKLAADERNEAKRDAYASFLANDIKSPNEPYDEKIRMMKTLEQIQPDHIRLLKALLQKPDPNIANRMFSGSIGQTLEKRLSDMTSDRVADLAQQMTDLRLAQLEGLNVMMTASGAEDLQNRLTTYGRRFVGYILS